MTTIFDLAHLKRLAVALSIGAVLAGGAVRANGVLGSVRASAQGLAAMFTGSATIMQGSLEILANLQS